MFLTLFSASRKQLVFSLFKKSFSPVFHRVFHRFFTGFSRGFHGGSWVFPQRRRGRLFFGGCGAHICPPPSVACGPDPALLAMRNHWGSTVTVQLQELSHLGDHARIETLLPEQQAQSNTFATPLQKRMHTLDCESHVIPSLTTTFIFR